jgi:hypothetical protein
MKRLLLVASLLSASALAVPPVSICDGAGTCPTVGQKTASGSFPVVVASDQSTLKMEGVDASAAAVTAKPSLAGGFVEADAAALDVTGMVEGDASPLKVNTEGRLLVASDHPNRFRCTVTVSTATTLQAVGGSCAAPGAGLSLYVTDVLFSASASGIAADAFPTLKYGTGGTCGTGTAVFWGALTAAAVVAEETLATPIKIPANNEICWISSTAGSKFVVLTGYIAP